MCKQYLEIYYDHQKMEERFMSPSELESMDQNNLERSFPHVVSCYNIHCTLVLYSMTHIQGDLMISFFNITKYRYRCFKKFKMPIEIDFKFLR